MSEYRVHWEIDIEADSAFEAAMLAKWMQLHGDWSSVFDVAERNKHGHGPAIQIDLDEQASQEQWDKILLSDHWESGEKA